MAGITTPFTTPVFPFLQTVSQRNLDNISPAFVLATGPSVEPIPLTPDAGLGQGVFSVDRDLGSGYVQQWNASMQRELASNIAVEVAYVGSKITRVGLPDSNLNQLTVDQLAQGAPLQVRVTTRTSASSRGRHRSAIRRSPVAQLQKPYPQYTTVSLYRNNVGTTHLPRRVRQAGTALLAGPVVSRQLHAVEARRRRLVGVRRVDSDRAGGELSGGRQLQPPARARRFERRHPARLRRVCGLGPAMGRRLEAATPAASGALVSDWTLTGVLTLQSGLPIAIGADDEQQRVRGIRHAAAQSRRRSRSCRQTNGRSAAGSTPARSRRRRPSRLARARAIRSGGRAIAIWTSR